MKENHSQFLNGKRSDNLKYWKHSLFVVSMLLFIICYLYVLKLYKFKILNTEHFYCNYFKMYLCKDMYM